MQSHYDVNLKKRKKDNNVETQTPSKKNRQEYLPLADKKYKNFHGFYERLNDLFMEKPLLLPKCYQNSLVGGSSIQMTESEKLLDAALNNPPPIQQNYRIYNAPIQQNYTIYNVSQFNLEYPIYNYKQPHGNNSLSFAQRGPGFFRQPVPIPSTIVDLTKNDDYISIKKPKIQSQLYPGVFTQNQNTKVDLTGERSVSDNTYNNNIPPPPLIPPDDESSDSENSFPSHFIRK